MAEGLIYVDSKLRRETSNFKISFSFDSSIVNSESSEPVLIKYIERNLKPEEFIGVIVEQSIAEGGAADIICYAAGSIAEGTPSYYSFITVSDITRAIITNGNVASKLFYVPSTGALSLNGPYVEDTTAKDIRIKMRANTGEETVTVDSIESGLSPEDFANVPVEMYKDGQLYMTERIASAVLIQNDTILLTIGTEEPLRLVYNPSTGDLVLRRQSGSSSL